MQKAPQAKPVGRPRLRDDNCGFVETSVRASTAGNRFKPAASRPLVAATGTQASPQLPRRRSDDGNSAGKIRLVNYSEEDLFPIDSSEATPAVDEAPALEAAPALETAVQQPELNLKPEPEEKRLRFKHIRDILPYEDYEPDPEVAAKDKCSNLCPRGPNCPECKERNGEVGADTLICPACPREQPVPGQDRTDVPLFAFPTRAFPHIHYCWEPSNLYHNPLYFEDFCLERYGHTRHYLLQPIVSTSIFAVQLLGIPYQASIDPIWKKRYTLGWHRPGKFVPYKYYQVPWNTEAALTEAAFVTGGYFLFAPSVSP